MNRIEAPVVGPEAGTVFKVAVSELAHVEAFAAAAQALPDGAVLRCQRFEAGQVVCRQGEPTGPAYHFLSPAEALPLLEARAACVLDDSGWAESIRQTRRCTEKESSPRRRPRALATLDFADSPGQPWWNRLSPTGRGASPRPSIPIDGPADLSREETEVTLHDGETYGETSALCRIPRASTVRSTCDAWVVALDHDSLRALHRCARFQAARERTYRRRMLRSQLQNLPLFAGLSIESLSDVSRRVELTSVPQGGLVFAEGEGSDALFLVRDGHVKVEHREGQKTRPVTYLGRGDYFGREGVFELHPEGVRCDARPRAARATAWKVGEGDSGFDRVELVRIPAALVLELAHRYGSVRLALRAFAAEHAPGAPASPSGDCVKQSADPLGLLGSRDTLLIDLEKCTGCGDCVEACASVHGGQAQMALDGPREGRHLLAKSCRDCVDPVCTLGCPVSAISIGVHDRVAVAEWCVGCGLCSEQCPNDAVMTHPRPLAGSRPAAAGPSIEERVATTCDGCAGLPGGARCVAVCAPQAAERVDGETALARLAVSPLESWKSPVKKLPPPSWNRPSECSHPRSNLLSNPRS